MSRFDPDHVFSVYHVLAPDGRGYIGCTSKTPDERWAGRVPAYSVSEPDPAKWLIEHAMKVYGKDNFVITHIGCAVGPAAAAEFETQAIAAWGTYKPAGYNHAARSNIQRKVPVKKVRPVWRDFIRVRRGPCREWPPQAQAA